MAEERRISPAVAIVGAGLALGVGGLLAYALTARAAPPVYTCPYCGAPFDTYEELLAHIESEHPGEPPLANVAVTVTDVDDQPIEGALLGLNSLQLSTDYNGNCQFTGLEAREYSGSCFKEGYRLASVILNGVGISFDPSGYF